MLLDRSWQAGKTYNFRLYPAGDEWQLALSDGETGKNYLSDAFKFGGEQKLQLKETTASPKANARICRVITQNRQALRQHYRHSAGWQRSDDELPAPVFWHAAALTLDGNGTLTNNQSGVKYRPNNQIGFYRVHYRRRQLGG